MSNRDFLYMTSTSNGTPFTTTSVTGFTDFQDFYIQGQTFTASFQDGSDNSMVALCHLDGSNNLVVDRVISTSSGINETDAPTFSGTTNIVVGASAENTTSHRPKSCPISAASLEERVVGHEGISSPTQSGTMIANRLKLGDFLLYESGWYYQFYVYELGAGVADTYRFGIYDIDHRGYANVPLMIAAETTHSNSSVDTYIDLETTLTITDATQANPVVVTYTGTDPANGDRIYITDVSGMTEINDRSFVVANINTGSNTLELKNEDGTSHTAYTSGGTVHFPVYLSAGQYAAGMVASGGVRFRGYSTSQAALKTWTGIRTGAAAANYLYKPFTYAALPTDPMSSGSWSSSTSTMPCIHIVRCADV